MSSLKDNVVIITGASTGIGEELAYRLAVSARLAPCRASR